MPSSPTVFQQPDTHVFEAPYLSEELVADVLEVVHHDAHEYVVEYERANQNPEDDVEIRQPSAASLLGLLGDVEPVVEREDLEERRHGGPHVAEPVPRARLVILELVGGPAEDDDAEDGEDVEEHAQQDRDEHHGREGVDDGRHQQTHLLDARHRLKRAEDTEDTDVVDHLRRKNYITSVR